MQEEYDRMEKMRKRAKEALEDQVRAGLAKAERELEKERKKAEDKLEEAARRRDMEMKNMREQMRIE